MFSYHAIIHLHSGSISAVYRYSHESGDHDAVAYDRAAAIANSPFNNGIEGSMMTVSGPENDHEIVLEARRYAITRDERGGFGAVPA